MGRHGEVALSLIFLLTIASFLAGCTAPVGDEDGESGEGRVEWPRCEHPWPCGDGSEWPENLTGPFDRLPPNRVQVPSFDGTMLDGAIWLPDAPSGTLLPTILYTSPYIGQCTYQSISQHNPSCRGSPEAEARVNAYNLTGLIQEGYAVAVFSVRGTGASGGCYDMWGPTEQKDQSELVEWLAEQPWSNGRVGMVGLSYSGTTPWEAAILAPDALKAIVVGGIITDVYLGTFSPQGAARSHAHTFMPGTMAENSFVPPAVADPEMMLPQYVAVAHERVCPETARTASTHPIDAMSDERDEEWFSERRLVDHFHDATAAPLILHGLQETNFHRYQNDIIWANLPNAPKGAVLGQWGHTTNLVEYLENFEGAQRWDNLQKEWFDFFLKGNGEPPSTLNRVQFQDSSRNWHEANTWPPEMSVNESLFLNGPRLLHEPAEGSKSISLAEPTMFRTDCQSEMNPGQEPVMVLYESEPSDDHVLVAGNPFAWLTVSSDRPRSQFEVRLVDLSPDYTFECDSPGMKNITDGAVDLAFHDGRMSATDFPTNTPTKVRVDFFNIAHLVEPGHRLGMIISNSAGRSTGVNHGPVLTIHSGIEYDSSQLVLPIFNGTFNGPSPIAEIPPRPFNPITG